VVQDFCGGSVDKMDIDEEKNKMEKEMWGDNERT